MTTLRTILAALAALTALAACNDNDKAPAPDNGLPAGYVWAGSNDALSADGRVNGSMLFFGRAEVETLSSGERYVDQKARFELLPGDAQSLEQQQLLALLMHETRFAAAMPALEMEAPDIAYSPATGGIDLAAERIVPRIAGTPYERYALTEIGGAVRGVEFTLTFVCAATYRVVYTGRLIVVAES